jgi:hypothetical protein
MTIVGWNDPGLWNQPTIDSLLELRRMEDPDIIFL